MGMNETTLGITALVIFLVGIVVMLEDLTDKVTVLTASVEGMEQEHIKELEATVQEQKSLLQKIGLKR